MKSFYKNNISGLLHNCDVEDRELLIEKLEEAFGQENVVPISNFNTMQLKSLVKDMSKFYGVPFEESNACTKKMDFEILPELKKQDRAASDMRYEDAIAFSPTFRDYMRKYPLIDEKIKILFRQPKAIGKHAGGVIVTENPGIGMPLIKVRGKIQSPWSEGLREKYLEPYGLIKFDLLGLKTLRIITRCARLILQRHVGEKTQICLSKAGRIIEKFSDEMCENKTFGEMSDDELKGHFKFSDATVYRYNGKDMTWPNVKKWIESHLHPDSINDQDEHVYKHVFDAGRFPGIFQFTEGGAQSFIKKFKPRNIIDIAMATAIYRPGPLKAKVDQLFLDARSGGAVGIMDHPALEKVFGETFGYCISGDTEIYVNDEKIKVEELVKTDFFDKKILSYDENEQKPTDDRIVDCKMTGVKEVFEIETEDGVLKLTADHRVLTKNGWKKVCELIPGDEIILCQ